MLSGPGLEEFLSKVANRFELVMLAAKRANELANGDQPLVKSHSKTPLIIA
ncbi:MAG: DNA-directed RNA polymerase subunit omega, partial [Nitrospirae bacterium]|nr:DNA-directed RNA polymerase subunit omega [Nitrospirota bacterium]